MLSDVRLALEILFFNTIAMELVDSKSALKDNIYWLLSSMSYSEHGGYKQLHISLRFKALKQAKISLFSK